MEEGESERKGGKGNWHWYAKINKISYKNFFLKILKILIYFYFACTSVLSACMSMDHNHALSVKAREG